MARKTQPLVKDIEIVYVDVKELKPAEWNPRVMPEAAYSKLQASLAHFGIVDPVIVRRSDNVVIGGHQRLRAAQDLGQKKVPVVYLDIDDVQAKALNIQLNNPNSQGIWDDDQLESLMVALDKEIPDLKITGFTADELKALADLSNFDTGTIDDQQRLDRKKKVKCPGCGYEFTP